MEVDIKLIIVSQTFISWESFLVDIKTILESQKFSESFTVDTKFSFIKKSFQHEEKVFTYLNIPIIDKSW